MAMATQNPNCRPVTNVGSSSEGSAAVTCAWTVPGPPRASTAPTALRAKSGRTNSTWTVSVKMLARSPPYAV
jgi:hypothetical protein